MLLRKSDMEIIKKYLEPVNDDTYRLKNVPIPENVRKTLLELDELQTVCYGTHMIEDYEKL